MHAAGADGLGSMKSQFKTADASGARYALIFGADELARGEVAVKSLRDAAAAQRTAAAGRRRRLGRRPAQRIIPGLPATTCTATSMATHLDLEEQEQLDQLKAFWKQYGNLITWVLIARARRLRGLERLELVAARPGRARPARCTTSSTAPRRPATPTRPTRVFADMKERFPRTAFTAAGRPAGRQRRSSTRARPTPRAPRWPGSRENARRDRVPDDRPAAPGRRAARPEEVRRGAEAARRRDAPRSSRRWSPTAAATSCWRRARATRPRRPTSKAWKAMDAKRRLPAPDRGQAHRARRRRRTTGAERRRGGEAGQVTRRRARRARAVAARLRCWRVLAGWRPVRAPTSRSRKPLEPIAAQIAARQVWNQSVGRVEFPLPWRVNGDVLHAWPAATARVIALEADTGRELWRASVGAKISAPASAATAASRRWSRATANWSRSKAARSTWRKRARRRASPPRRWWPASASSCSASTAPCRPSTRSTAASCGRCSARATR